MFNDLVGVHCFTILSQINRLHKVAQNSLDKISNMLIEIQ